MISFKSILVKVLVCWLLIGLAFNIQGQTPAQNEWKRYELGKGNFSVLLPSEPKETFLPAEPNDLIKINCHLYTAEPPDGSLVASYCAMDQSASQWTKANTDSFYDGILTGLTEAYQKQIAANNLSYTVTVSPKRDIDFSGRKGREVEFAVGPWHGRIRMTAVGRHAFIATDFGTEKLSTADRQKFFDSIILTPKPTGVNTKTN
jgi:hypothetical protein